MPERQTSPSRRIGGHGRYWHNLPCGPGHGRAIRIIEPSATRPIARIFSLRDTQRKGTRFGEAIRPNPDHLHIALATIYNIRPAQNRNDVQNNLAYVAGTGEGLGRHVLRRHLWRVRYGSDPPPRVAALADQPASPPGRAGQDENETLLHAGCLRQNPTPLVGVVDGVGRLTQLPTTKRPHPACRVVKPAAELMRLLAVQPASPPGRAGRGQRKGTRELLSGPTCFTARTSRAGSRKGNARAS